VNNQQWLLHSVCKKQRRPALEEVNTFRRIVISTELIYEVFVLEDGRKCVYLRDQI
jgi:hypothetical protein